MSSIQQPLASGSLIMQTTSNKKIEIPTFQLIPPMDRKDSKEQGTCMCQYCNVNTHVSTFASGLLAPTMTAAAPIIAHNELSNISGNNNQGSQENYKTLAASRTSSRAGSSNSDTINNNNNNNIMISSNSMSPSPASTASHHQSPVYCYCSRCTSRDHHRRVTHRGPMYSKFKTAGHAASAVARFESSLTAKQQESMFDHDPEKRSHHKTAHGCFRKSIPSMPLVVAIICCFFNFFTPGFGTLLASFSIPFGCVTGYGVEQKTRAFCLGILISLIQMLTAVFVIGWTWSIFWGIHFVTHSSTASFDESAFLVPSALPQDISPNNFSSSSGVHQHNSTITSNNNASFYGSNREGNISVV